MCTCCALCTSPAATAHTPARPCAVQANASRRLAGPSADKAVAGVDASAYSALMLPGGVANPDQLRANEDAVKFVRAFFDAGKPVAAICHAPWLLIEAGVVEGRTLTGYPSIRTDLRNAGATVVDEEVVVDEGLVTSRNPDDIPAFNAKMIEEFAEGGHRGQAEKAEAARPAAH